jgi:hypothetical protein
MTELASKPAAMGLQTAHEDPTTEMALMKTKEFEPNEAATDKRQLLDQQHINSWGYVEPPVRNYLFAYYIKQHGLLKVERELSPITRFHVSTKYYCSAPRHSTTNCLFLEYFPRSGVVEVVEYVI